jgi:tetratricopeptide (TPR) repeat protein
MTERSTGRIPNQPPGPLLPWWLAAGALLFYWVTLNHWASLASLPTVFPIWEGHSASPSGRPLAGLAFVAARGLPQAAIPLVLNLVTAVVAAFVLGQLARSVAILRVDVVAADAMRQRVAETAVFTGPLAWLPPAFAVLALGLQAGFWEHATNATGEMFSVACFAFAGRAIWEHRRGREEQWLYRGAFAFALGLTDNWWGLAYLPGFIGAVIWTKGFSPFLEVKFLARLTGAALVGLSLYLLVPLLSDGLLPGMENYWATLRSYLGQQKAAVLAVRAPAFWGFGLVGLLPFLLLAVRWRSHSVQLADDTRQGVWVTKWSGHGIHAVFLLTALWLSWQPVFTPYQTRLTPPPLVYAYSWAVVAGYTLAYLLVFSMRRGSRSPARWPRWLAVGLFGMLPAVLLGKNWSDLRLTNGGALQEFARQLSADFPPAKLVVLSDDPRLLRLAQLATPNSAAIPPVWVDTGKLAQPQYQAQLSKAHPDLWPAALSNSQSSATWVELVGQAATNASLVYLHPSSGVFLERFTATPRGWGQELQFRTASNSGLPPLSAETALWEEQWNKVLARRAEQLAAARKREAFWAQPVFRALKLAGPTNDTARFLGEAQAKNFNYFGVALAQRGDAAGAARWYERALHFNPANLSARINLEFLNARQRGETRRLLPAQIDAWLTSSDRGRAHWAEVVSRHGPVDEPTALVQVGRMYLLAGHPHQALARLTRSVELAPEWRAAQLARAQGLTLLGDFRAVETATAALPQAAEAEEWPAVALVQLLETRAVALRQLGRTNEATAFIETFTQAHQAVVPVVSGAVELYAASGAGAAELRWLEHLLRQDPKRVEWLVAKGDAEFRQGDFTAALRSLDQALRLAPTEGAARGARARVAVAAGELEVAAQDYHALLNQPEHVPGALFGLGGIAWRQQNTNAMMAWYEAFLTNHTATPQQIAVANRRLKAGRNE